MSGQLVGEVIQASARLRADRLSKNGFLALIGIAEKCHPQTRQGSVRWDHLSAALYGASKRTAKRAVHELTAAGLVAVVKPGWGNQHGDGHAPIYELRMGPNLASSTPEDGAKMKEDGAKMKEDGATHPPLNCGDISLDGSIDGSIDGGAPPPTATQTTEPSRFCNDHPHGTPQKCRPCQAAREKNEAWRSEQTERRRAAGQARREAINACTVCDDQGHIDAGIDDHGNEQILVCGHDRQEVPL